MNRIVHGFTMETCFFQEGCIHSTILGLASSSNVVDPPQIIQLDPRAGNAFVKRLLEMEKNSSVKDWIAEKTRRITNDRTMKKAQVKLFMKAWMDNKLLHMEYSLSPEARTMFEDVEKKDDMADACFQLLSVCSTI